MLLALPALAEQPDGYEGFSEHPTVEEMPLVEPGEAGEASETDGIAESEISQIDGLLEALANAPDSETASRIEQSVLQAWLESGSDTVDLLMVRAVGAMDSKDYGIALELLDAIVEMRPAYAEGWNKRATLYYLIDDYDRAMRDILKVLELEPRHFGALSGLGLILQEVGQKRGALEAFRRALAVHPYLGNVRDSIDALETEVEGEGI